jgi:glutamine synthetase
MTTTNSFPDLLSEVRAFRAQHPAVRYVDLISLDIPGHFYGKRYPVEMLEKVAAGSPLKIPQNCVLLGAQGGLYPIGDYCFNDGDPDAPRRLIPGTLKPVLAHLSQVLGLVRPPTAI